MHIGDAAPLYKAANRKRTPRRRGPAKILASGAAGVAGEIQSQTFKVARGPVGKQVEEKDAEEVGWNPSPGQPQTIETASWGNITLRDEGNGMEVEEEKVGAISGAGAPGGGSHISLRAIPTPALLSLTVQLPPSAQAAVPNNAPGSSLGRNCEQSQASVVDRARYGRLTWGRLREQCSQRG